MFEKATRLKLKFNFKGLCSVEDLWDLSVEELDYIFKSLNAQLKTHKEESLLETKNKEEEITDLKVAIVKHIVKVKLQEQQHREDEAVKTQKKHKLLEIIAEKQDAELKDLSVETLTKLLEEL